MREYNYKSFLLIIALSLLAISIIVITFITSSKSDSITQSTIQPMYRDTNFSSLQKQSVAKLPLSNGIVSMQADTLARDMKEELFTPKQYIHKFTAKELNSKYYTPSFLFLYSDLRAQVVNYCNQNIQTNQTALINCQTAEIANGSLYPITIAASYLFNHMFTSIYGFVISTIILFGLFFCFRLYIGMMLFLYYKITHRENSTSSKEAMAGRAARFKYY